MKILISSHSILMKVQINTSHFNKHMYISYLPRNVLNDSCFPSSAIHLSIQLFVANLPTVKDASVPITSGTVIT